LWWDVLDGWWSLATSHWSPGSSAGMSWWSCSNSICISIAQSSISQNQSPYPRSCQCLLCFARRDWTYDDTKPDTYT
jgi:hypothetical protein